MGLMKKSSYQERNTIARELYQTFVQELSEVNFRIDETIGLNSTNPVTRASLREIRSQLSQTIEKSRHIRQEKFELTPREMDVLIHLSSGASVKEICERLFLAQPTVKSHLAGCYRKLGVTNRVEAITAAQKLGLLP